LPCFLLRRNINSSLQLVSEPLVLSLLLPQLSSILGKIWDEVDEFLEPEPTESFSGECERIFGVVVAAAVAVVVADIDGVVVVVAAAVVVFADGVAVLLVATDVFANDAVVE